MSIEEIIEKLEEMAEDREDKILPGCLGYDEIEPLREAIALLRTHPEAQPDEPLTMEELREMVGRPVWTVTKGISDPGRWELVIDAECEDRLEMVDGQDGFYEIDTDSYGKTWLAYRRPPKEGGTP